MVKEILTDDQGNVTGVTYFDAHDRLQEQPADLVVVSAAAIETARLLLNSKSRLFPNGLGNRYDWVGRNLQGHAYSGAVGLFDFDTYDDVGPGATIAICDFNHGNPGLRGGAMLGQRVHPPAHPVRGHARPERCPLGQRAQGLHAQVLPPHHRSDGPRAGDAGVRFPRAAGSRVKDFWGMPVARLSGGRHPHTVEIADVMAAKAEAWLKEAGAIHTWRSVPGMA